VSHLLNPKGLQVFSAMFQDHEGRSRNSRVLPIIVLVLVVVLRFLRRQQTEDDHDHEDDQETPASSPILVLVVVLRPGLGMEEVC
jgi:hypothetical protein